MVVEDKEGMALATGGVAWFLSQFISKTHQHTTGPHGREQLGFILIFSSFLLLSVTGWGGDPIPVIERVAPTSPWSESIIHGRSSECNLL